MTGSGENLALLGNPRYQSDAKGRVNSLSRTRLALVSMSEQYVKGPWQPGNATARIETQRFALNENYT